MRKEILVSTVFIFFVGCGGGLDDLVTKLNQVNDSFVPATLVQNNSSIQKDGQRAGNPCAGITGDSQWDIFLKCQPTLLKAYLATAKAFFGATIGMVQEFGGDLASKDEGSFGSENIGNGETFYWGKTSETEYQFLITKSSGSVFYLWVKGSTYVLKLDGAEIGQSGKFQADVSYTSDSQWGITVRLTGVACDPANVDSPERMKIIVSRDGSLWRGKEMSYHPYYSTCDTTATDGQAMNIYTDFASDERAAKGSVYFMNRTVSDLSNITNYQLGNACVNSSAFCGGDTTSYVSNVPLPFCAVASSLVPVWGNNCSSYSTAVSSAGYLEASLWIAPSTFYQQEGITLPATL